MSEKLLNLKTYQGVSIRCKLREGKCVIYKKIRVLMFSWYALSLQLLE